MPPALAGRAVTGLLSVEFLVLVALRRVRRGGVARRGDRFYGGGLPLGGLLAAVLAQLLEEGSLEEGVPGAEDGMSRIWRTEAGADRYAVLADQHRPRAALPVPAPEHGHGHGHA